MNIVRRKNSPRGPDSHSDALPVRNGVFTDDTSHDVDEAGTPSKPAKSTYLFSNTTSDSGDHDHGDNNHGVADDDDDDDVELYDHEQAPIHSRMTIALASAPWIIWAWIRYACRVFRKQPFFWVKLSQVLSGLFILLLTFPEQGALGPFGGVRDPETGFIVDVNSQENTNNGVIGYVANDGSTEYTRAVVATTTGQMVLLGLARFTGFAMYPVVVLIVFSKLRALQAFFAQTAFGVFFHSDTHRLHIYAGWSILFLSIAHTSVHLSRWDFQGNLHLLWEHPSGVTGLVVMIAATTLILPFGWPRLKARVSFEARKYTHLVMFWIFMLAMLYHVPHAVQNLPGAGYSGIVFPLLLSVYVLDALYVKAFMTEKVTSVHYELTKGSGVQLTMRVSDRFHGSLNSGGYCYIMFEWIDRHQWHAFSIYEDPENETNRRLFIAKAGDSTWTSKVHDALRDRSTVRPCWIQGPFPSPYHNAQNFDNMILVAAGIGITPALSAIEAFRHTQRVVSLIWTVRDPSMLLFFLKSAKLDHKGFNIVFYTGKEPLPDEIENKYGNVNLTIVRGERPKVSFLLPNIIRYIDQNGQSDQSTKLLDKCKLAMALVKQHDADLKRRQPQVTDHERLTAAIGFADRLGYDLTELMSSVSSMVNENEDLEVGRADNLDINGMGKSILMKIEQFPSTPSDVLSGHGAHCNCHPDALACPDHLHSVWKTRNEQLIASSSISLNATNIWEHNANARPYVKAMPKDHRSHWGFLYCGGRNQLLMDLVKESKDLKIHLHEEAFDW